MKKGLKKLLALGVVAVLSVGMVGCGGKKDVSKLQEIKDNKKLIIGTSPDYPPFEFLVSEDGKSKIVGADIDLAKKIAEKAGVELEIKAMDFDALIPALTSKQVDMVITGMTPNEKRKESVDFSDIYFEGKNGVLVKAADADKFKTEADLKKAKLGVQRGSVQETYVKEQLKIEDYKALVNIPDLVIDLKAGNIDAIILNDKVANINQGKYEGTKVLQNVDLVKGGEEESMAIAVQKGNNKEFLELMNGVIKELNASGEYDKILANAVDLVSKEVK